MPRINGDLIPSVSGLAQLGVDGGTSAGAFDITTITPFGQIHQLSGIFHDPLLGQSGVLRYSRQAAAFQVSVDGGRTFADINTGLAGGVTSVGVIGDTDLTGNIDLASPASGFIAIEDSSNASPLLFSVDQLGLSGLWDFPTQGFNGRVVNALTDDNGTESQGIINLTGASGITVDIVGQTATFSADGIAEELNLPVCYAETFTSAIVWGVAHNLGSEDVVVMTFDDSSPRQWIQADNIIITDSDNLNVRWASAQAGRVVVLVCQ